MNNRNLLIAALGLIASIPAFAGAEREPAATDVVKQVIPAETYDWNDDSTEVNLVRRNEIGVVQEVDVVEVFNSIFAQPKYDTVWLLDAEPFLFEGKEFGTSSDYAEETIES